MKWRNRMTLQTALLLPLTELKYRVVTLVDEETLIGKKRWNSTCGGAFFDFRAAWATAGQDARILLGRIGKEA